ALSRIDQHAFHQPARGAPPVGAARGRPVPLAARDPPRPRALGGVPAPRAPPVGAARGPPAPLAARAPRSPRALGGLLAAHGRRGRVAGRRVSRVYWAQAAAPARGSQTPGGRYPPRG